MKNLFWSASLLVATLLFCGNSYGQNRENRDVSGFTHVSFGISGNLFIKTGPQFSLVLEGDKNILDDIETEVSGNKLVIRKENWRSSLRDEKVTVNLTMPQIEGLSVSGSGKLEISNPVVSDNLSLAVSGSGKILTTDLDADDLNCAISGSGDIILGGKGSVDDGEISISGSGSFSGEAVEIDHLEIGVSGSGNCVCNVKGTLDASVSGSGDILYSGNPKIDARVSGSGRVRSR
ncbi:MAG: DUF2807 domain-containing protein [Bacteroidales bacterium]|nr:DUF2807 domain-containing protein [Bacteroidales bacterium]